MSGRAPPHRDRGRRRDRPARPVARRADPRPARSHRAARSDPARLYPPGRRSGAGGGARRRARGRARAPARSAAWRARGHQGHHRCRRTADDVPLEDPAQQRRPRRCRRGGAAARGGGDRARQARDARVRHRRPELRPAVSAGAQSVESGASSRRLLLGFRRRRRGRTVPAGARHRYRRLGAQSGELLRHRRAEADLRPGLATRRLPAGIHARSCRAAGADRRRCGADARRDRRARSRRSGQRRHRRRRFRARSDMRRARPAHRLRPPLPRGRHAGRPARWRRRWRRWRACSPREGAEVRTVHAAELDRVCRRQPRDPDLARPIRSTRPGCASAPATTGS